MDSQSLDRTGTSLEKQKHASPKAPLSADEVGGEHSMRLDATLRARDPRDPRDRDPSVAGCK